MAPLKKFTVLVLVFSTIGVINVSAIVLLGKILNSNVTSAYFSEIRDLSAEDKHVFTEEEMLEIENKHSEYQEYLSKNQNEIRLENRLFFFSKLIIDHLITVCWFAIGLVTSWWLKNRVFLVLLGGVQLSVVTAVAFFSPPLKMILLNFVVFLLGILVMSLELKDTPELKP